jgi:hypothetical protein
MMKEAEMAVIPARVDVIKLFSSSLQKHSSDNPIKLFAALIYGFS